MWLPSLLTTSDLRMSPYPGKAHTRTCKNTSNTAIAQLHFKKVIDQLLPLLPEEKRSKVRCCPVFVILSATTHSNHLLRATTQVQIALLSGERTGYRHDTDRELPFRQESNFFYLSGCDLPSSALLLVYDPSDKKYESHLLIPEEDPLVTMWSPPPPTLDAARGLYDATLLGFTSQLVTVLDKLLSTRSDAVVHTLPKGTDLFPALHPEFSNVKLSNASTEQYLLTAIHRARLIKTDAEIELMRKANEISSRAHEVVMRLLGQGVLDLNRSVKAKSTGTPNLPTDWRITREAEAEAVFVASCRREGAIHQAYMPIVAASTRASTLHYCCNDKEFAWGPEVHSRVDIECDHQHGCFASQVLLIDAGCEWNNYAADSE
jgi:Xaa-Pro dipeptidase